MPELSIDFDVICGACRSALDADVDAYGNVRVEPCEKCMAYAAEEAVEAAAKEASDA